MTDPLAPEAFIVEASPLSIDEAKARKLEQFRDVKNGTRDSFLAVYVEGVHEPVGRGSAKGRWTPSSVTRVGRSVIRLSHIEYYTVMVQSGKLVQLDKLSSQDFPPSKSN